MSSFSKLKETKIWVSMLVGYIDRNLRFLRVFVAIIGVSFYLVIETGIGEAIMMEFDSHEEAKQWVAENMLSDNAVDTNHFWTHFYSPYGAWLKEEFNINAADLIKKRVALSAVKQEKKHREAEKSMKDICYWSCYPDLFQQFF